MNHANDAVTPVVTAVPVLAYSITFVIAAFITGINLVTEKYPNSLFLIKTCMAFYAYCLLYGLIASLLLWLSPNLITQKILDVTIADCNSIYVIAILIGLFTKPLMHMRVAGIDEKPYGPEAAAKVLESGLIRAVRNHHQHKLWKFLKPYLIKYTDVTNAQNVIIAHIPDEYSLDEIEAITIDIKRADRMEVLFQRYLKLFGAHNFQHLFPL